MNRILAISWCLPPLVAPQSIQMARSLRSLSEKFEVTALCAELRSTQMRDDVLAQWYNNSFNRIAVSEEAPRRSLLGRLRRQIQFSEDHWATRTIERAEQLHASTPFDVVISFAQPWVDHLAGLELKRQWDLPWLAHFSDPWVDNSYCANVDQSIMDKWREQEKAVIANADAVIFTSPRTVDLVMRKYPDEWRDRVSVIPHCFDPSLCEKAKKDAPRSELTMLHTGDFYGQRDPGGLLQALNELCHDPQVAAKLRVVLIGDIPPSFAAIADAPIRAGVLSCEPKQPYSEVMRRTEDADVLLLVEAPADESVFLPSKLIEYIGFRKPVLALTPTNGTSADLLRRLDQPVVPPNDPTAIASAIKKMFDDWGDGGLTVSKNYDEVACEFEMDSTGRQFAGVVQQLLADTSGT